MSLMSRARSSSNRSDWYGCGNSVYSLLALVHFAGDCLVLTYPILIDGE